MPGGIFVIIRHPGQVPRSGMRAGIQDNLIFRHFSGFPFGFAQGGESFDLAQDRELVERPVEPRVSPKILRLARKDNIVELKECLLSYRQEMENNEKFLLTLRRLSTPARESELERAAQGQS